MASSLALTAIALSTTLATSSGGARFVQGNTVPPPPRLSLGARTQLPPATAEQRAQTQALIERIREAEQRANEDPEKGLEPLRRVLDEAQSQPELLARSPEAHEARIYALLALARAHLVVDRGEDAEATLDEAIRVARGDTLPVKLFGPTLTALHDARLDAPENRPQGRLEVQCTPGCDVLVDERLAGSGEMVTVTGLPLGAHRVTVLPKDDRVQETIEQRTMVFGPDAAAQSLTYEGTVPADAPPDEGKALEDSPVADSGSGRKLPRWAGALGIAVGAAVAISGGILIGIDGRCTDLADASTQCSDIYTTQNAGIAMTAVGGALLVGFSVALAIGEVKDKRYEQSKKKTATVLLGYTARF